MRARASVWSERTLGDDHDVISKFQFVFFTNACLYNALSVCLPLPGTALAPGFLKPLDLNAKGGVFSPSNTPFSFFPFSAP